MIVRIWRGRASLEQADAYQTHVVTKVFPKLLGIHGYGGGRVLRRKTADGVEFLVQTEWNSWKAIYAFAGDNPDVAVIEPEARALLVDADERVRHFEIAHQSTVPRDR